MCIRRAPRIVIEKVACSNLSPSSCRVHRRKVGHSYTHLEVMGRSQSVGSRSVQHCTVLYTVCTDVCCTLQLCGAVHCSPETTRKQGRN